MNGVTMELTAVTSPLGKLSLPCPWNHRFGSPGGGPLSRGLTRENVTFISCATSPAATDESIDLQNVLPRRDSPPSQSAPPTSAAMRPYSTNSWLLRFQMPLSSYGTRRSMPARQSDTAPSSSNAAPAMRGSLWVEIPMRFRIGRCCLRLN